MKLFCINPFKYDRGHFCFVVNKEITVDTGEVLVIQAEADSFVSAFLEVLAGLDSARRMTGPAAEGEIVRPLLAPDNSNPDAILLRGIPIQSLPPEERAKNISFVFDNPELAVVGSTVAEELRYTTAALGGDVSCVSPQVLEPYGLYEKLERATSVLSGGELHRLAIACAMERDARLLVLDLTRSNLDRNFEDWLLNRIDSWLQARAQQGGAAVVIAGVSADRIDHHVSAPRQYALLRKSGAFCIEKPIEVSNQIPVALTNELRQRPKDGEVLVTAKNLGRYKHGRSVSFQLHSGEILAFHGPNGCGKTSVAMRICEREGQSNFTGAIEIASGVRPALALQFAERSFIGLTAGKEIVDQELGRLLGFTSEELDSHPRALPYSKQKLLSSAIALQSAARVVVLDEPTCGMDTASRETLCRLLMAKKDAAILVFTHDIGLQEALISREFGK